MPALHRLAVAGLASAAFVTAAVPAFASASAPAAPADPVFAVVAVVGAEPSGYHDSLARSLAALEARGAIDAYAVSPTSVEGAPSLLAQYASEGWGAVIVEGGEFAGAVAEAAAAFPQDAFVWIPGGNDSNAPAGASNVSAVFSDASYAGEVAATLLSGRPNLVWDGVPEPSGDDALFAQGFAARRGVSLTDIAAPAGQPAAPYDAVIVDAATTTALPATTTLKLAGVADRPEADGEEVALQYHYDVALAEIMAGFAAGSIGGRTHLLTFGNGGLSFDANGAGLEVAAAEALNQHEQARAEADRRAEAERQAAAEQAERERRAAAEDNGNNNDNSGGGSSATQPPTTPAPGGQPPATQPPATQPPATQPPATQPPSRTIGDCQGMGVGGANDMRAAAGVAPLSSGGLGSCSWARHLAETNTFTHGNSGSAEVIYKGQSCGNAWGGWRNSAPHYAILIGTGYSVGDFACVADSRGTVWAVGRLS